MIACVLCLAGCNGKESVSDFQQTKMDYAIDTAKAALGLLKNQAEKRNTDELSEYTKEEIATALVQTYKMEFDGGSYVGMVTSFEKGIDEIGDFDPDNDLGEATARVDKHQIIVDIPVKGSKGEAVAEFVISNDTFQKVEGAALNPKKTFGQMMQKAGLNTVIGMGTVFSMLLFMSILISCFGIIPKIMGQGKKENEVKSTTGIENAVAQITTQEDQYEETDDCELVAVIAAAIAAYEGSTSTDGFVVRSIRKRNK